MTRSEKISVLLKKREMTHGDLTRAADLSRSTMCRVMKADHVLSEDTILKIANALNVTPGYLRGDYAMPSHLTEDDIAFLVDLRNTPYLKLVKELVDKGLTVQDLQSLIRILKCSI